MRRLTDIDLRQLRIFRAIVECQGLAGAEFVLNLSQSRISEGLAALEARVGARLCRRGRAGFALTKAGEELHAATHELFSAVDRFSARAGGIGASFRRVFRLGAVDALVGNSDLELARVLRRFSALCPAVVVDFAVSGPEELEKSLGVGGRDVVIMPSINRKAEFDYTPVMDERQSLYCGKLHALFDRSDDRISTADLAAQPFVARGYLHHRDLRLMGHREPQATVEMMEAQLILILSGGYIGYLPAHYAQPWVERGELRAIQDARFSYDSPFFLVTQRGGAGNPLIRHFRTAIDECLANRPQTGVTAG